MKYKIHPIVMGTKIFDKNIKNLIIAIPVMWYWDLFLALLLARPFSLYTDPILVFPD